MNLFATVLTNSAPSANYRGESELNRAVMQRVTEGRFEYPVISPEAIRNALREILAGYKLPVNRERLHNEEQLAVRFRDYPYPDRYADDFFFGYLVADRKQIPADVVKERGLEFKRDSILRMNLAKGLEPYRHDALFTQSPLTMRSPWKNAEVSALLHRETAVTAYQYPFALNLHDCRLDDDAPPVDGVMGSNDETRATRGEQHKNWLRFLLKAISELNGVAGNHARSYFEMAPASIVIRLTDSLVAGFELYCFKPDGSAPEVIDGIKEGDFPGEEFVLGGRLVREVLSADDKVKLEEKKVKLCRTGALALNEAARRITDQGFLREADDGGC